jgi:molecular chaperone GrpE
VAQQLDEARRQLHAELQATRQALARTKAALHEQQREARSQQRAVDRAEAEASRARQALASSQREALADAHRAQAELDTLRSETHDLRLHLQARDQPTDDAQRAMILGLVDVYDSIHRALAASQDTTSPFHEGYLRVRDQLHATLRGAGATLVGAAGEPFDPTLHEAIAVQPHSTHPPDTLHEVVTHGVRDATGALLRPARVVVSHTG